MSTHIENIEHIENAHFHNNNTPSLPSNISDDIKPDFKLLYDSLKDRYQKRFDSKLDGRFEITLEVKKDWNVNQPETFKVNYREDTNIDEAFRTINEAFNQKGRLLIVGSPGSGKTVLLLKLAIELLGKDCKADQKLPVIFNLASWSPDYAKFDNWLIDVLNAGNGLSKDFARTLLEQNRIIFLLDGLDELARNEAVETAIDKRAKCLDSLNDYLRMGRKAVICCRRKDFAEMQTASNQDAPVSAKVEVLDLGKAELILALQHAQSHNESRASANNLLQIIETNDVFLEVLATPFYFTTALEVFDKQLLDEKQFSKNAKAIKKYLLDNFIESKLQHTSKLTEFEKDKTKILKWLSWLAKLMEKKQLVNFELADLQPTDLIVPNARLPKYEINTEDALSLKLNDVYFWRRFVAIWSLSLTFVLVYIIIQYGSVINPGTIVLITLITGLFMIVVTFLISMNEIKSISRFVNLETSYQRLFGGLFFNSILAFLYLFLGVSIPSFSLRILGSNNPLFILMLHVGFIFLSIMQFKNTPLFQHSFLRCCLAAEGSMPIKYATLLNYAADARILEKDGGHWRFRHQTLQEHFAKIDA